MFKAKVMAKRMEALEEKKRIFVDSLGMQLA